MIEVNGRLELRSREGLKVLPYEEHPRGDGSLRILTIPEHLNAREFRTTAEMLENRERSWLRIEPPERERHEGSHMRKENFRMDTGTSGRRKVISGDTITVRCSAEACGTVQTRRLWTAWIPIWRSCTRRREGQLQ